MNTFSLAIIVITTVVLAVAIIEVTISKRRKK